LEEELTRRTPDSGASDEEIENMLTAAANEASRRLAEKDGMNKSKRDAGEIIAMGMAVYGNGSKVKITFDRKSA
jgi:hypothetical protein